MKNEKGFTLIELTLYMGISAALLLALSVFFSVLLQTRTKSESIATVDDQGAAVLALMTRTARNAVEITAPAAGGNGTSLTLVVDDPGLSPTVFSVSGGVLMMTEGLADPVALTSDSVTVTGMSVENVSRTGTPGSVRVSFTLSRVNQGGRNAYTYEKVFKGSASLR